MTDLLKRTTWPLLLLALISCLLMIAPVTATQLVNVPFNGAVSNSFTHQPISGALINITGDRITPNETHSDSGGNYLFYLDVFDSMVYLNCIKDGYRSIQIAGPFFPESFESPIITNNFEMDPLQQPEITDCTPVNATTNNASVPFTLTCSGFSGAPYVWLSMAGQSNISASDVSIDGTNISGTFDLTDAPPGNWNVSAGYGDAFSPMWDGTFTVDPVPTMTLTGTVVDKFTGLPLSNAEILLRRGGSHTFSSPDGKFTLSTTVYGDGMELGVRWGKDSYIKYMTSVSITEADLQRGLKDLGTLELTPVFAGHVTNKVTGQPVSGANISIRESLSGPPLVSMISDDQGYFIFQHRDEGINQNGLRNTGTLHLYMTAVRDGYLPYSIEVNESEFEDGIPHNIQLIPLFAANFLALGHVGQAPYSVRFMDQSTGSPTAWNWDFGDGTTSTEQNPTHIYTQTGVYNVVLNASDGQMSDTSTQYRCIIVNTVPVAAFTANTTTGRMPFTVQFTDQSSYATGYQWQFGDGQTSTEQNPVHTYTGTGSYTVTLTVSVPDYGSVFTQKPGYITVTDPAAVGFSANVTSGLSPLPVQFNESTNGSVQYFYWQFGDHTTSNEQNPVHIYGTAGRYTVSLMTVGSNGTEVKTVENYINVTAPVAPTVTPIPTSTQTIPLPVANFTVTTGSSGSLEVQVTDTSVNATSVRYDLGEGTSTAYRNFQFTYSQAGTYTIEQTATNSAGSTHKTLSVTVPVVTPTSNPAYNGPHTIPGILQAEDYNLGGEGVAYHDTTAGNTGGAYRHDDVDIEQLDTDGSPNIGWIRSGEWLAYTVNVATAGTYDAGFRVSSSHAGSSIKVYVDDGTTPVATVNVPNTGDWPVFQTVLVPVTLPAGQHRLKLSFPTDFVNINWINFA